MRVKIGRDERGRKREREREREGGRWREGGLALFVIRRAKEKKSLGEEREMDKCLLSSTKFFFFFF